MHPPDQLARLAYWGTGIEDLAITVADDFFGRRSLRKGRGKADGADQEAMELAMGGLGRETGILSSPGYWPDDLGHAVYAVT